MNARESQVRDQLLMLADTGATFNELQAELRTHPGLSQTTYDGLWLYAWALIEGQGARITTGQNGDAGGYLDDRN